MSARLIARYSPARALLYADFGDRLVPYELALQLQHTLRGAISSHGAPDVLLVVQHPPVYTVGKRGQQQDFLVSADFLQKNGIDVHRVPRGGETTFHGPGQLVLYPIVNLRRLKKGARAYVEGLEDTIVATLNEYGLQAEGRQPAGRTGVWVEDRKIAALGVQISGGIAIHGTALNVATDLKHFNHIIPCGLRQSKVTSLEKETQSQLALNEVSRHLKSSFSNIFAYDMFTDLNAETLLSASSSVKGVLDVLGNVNSSKGFGAD